jgi:hypothetical protein
MRGNVGKVAQTLGPLRLDHDELAKLRPLGQSRKAEVDHFSRAPKSLAGSALHEVAANWAVPTCLHRVAPIGRPRRSSGVCRVAQSRERGDCWLQGRVMLFAPGHPVLGITFRTVVTCPPLAIRALLQQMQ